MDSLNISKIVIKKALTKVMWNTVYNHITHDSCINCTNQKAAFSFPILELYKSLDNKDNLKINMTEKALRYDVSVNDALLQKKKHNWCLDESQSTRIVIGWKVKVETKILFNLVKIFSVKSEINSQVNTILQERLLLS